MKSTPATGLVASALAAPFAALTAHATGLATCDSGPTSGWQPQATLEKQLIEQKAGRSDRIKVRRRLLRGLRDEREGRTGGSVLPSGHARAGTDQAAVNVRSGVAHAPGSPASWRPARCASGIGPWRPVLPPRGSRAKAGAPGTSGWAMQHCSSLRCASSGAGLAPATPASPTSFMALRKPCGMPVAPWPLSEPRQRRPQSPGRVDDTGPPRCHDADRPLRLALHHRPLLGRRSVWRICTRPSPIVLLVLVALPRGRLSSAASLRHRENLVAAMIHGRKRPPSGDDIA